MAPEECTPTCTTACSGSCTAQANVECQVACQTDVTVAGDRYQGEEPRSYIGWGAVRGLLARGYNQLGQHEKAKQTCEQALASLNDADVEYVSHFLELELQCALADAGLGNTETALARLDRLIARFKDSNHTLLQGNLHETRARVCFGAGRMAEYRRDLAEVRRWFSPTAAPILVAKYNRLAELDPESHSAQAGVGEVERRRPSMVPTSIVRKARRSQASGSSPAAGEDVLETEALD